MTVDAPSSPSLNPRSAKRREDSIHSSDPVCVMSIFSTRGRVVISGFRCWSLARKPQTICVASPPPPWTIRARPPPSSDLTRLRAQTGRRPICAAQHMRVVARQQHRLAGAHFHGVLPRHLQPPSAPRHIVVGDELNGIVDKGPAILGGKAGSHAPRRGEARLHEDAARQPDGLQHIRQRIHDAYPSAAGQSVNSSGGSVIHAAHSALYLILNATMLEVTQN